MSVTSIIGPPLMTNLFAWFTRKDAPVFLPGAPFLAGSFLILISAVLAFRNMKKYAR
jgi:DHA1 family tetracycline resistance protein-like MFS transporter